MISVADFLIRNIDDDDLKLLDSIAARQGLSRNELLRRLTHEFTRSHAAGSVNADDLRRSLSLSKDLLDDEIMRGGWE